jgi:hypothetical protein
MQAGRNGQGHQGLGWRLCGLRTTKRQRTCRRNQRATFAGDVPPTSEGALMSGSWSRFLSAHIVPASVAYFGWVWAAFVCPRLPVANP